MEITKKELKLLCFLYSFGFISGNVPSEYQTKYVISFGSTIFNSSLLSFSQGIWPGPLAHKDSASTPH